MLLNVSESDSKITITFKKLKTSKVIDDLIKFLNSIKNSKKKIILDFTHIKENTYSNTHTTISGVIEYYRKTGLNVEVIDKGYICATSINEPVCIVPLKYISKNDIFDKVIKFDKNISDYIVDSIINQIKCTIVCERNVLSSLSWCLKEIMDNVVNHSGMDYGLIMAQMHPHRRFANVSIYDNGIGLMNSFLESGNYFPKNEIESIELALSEKITRDPNVGQGNGLWGLKQLVKDNKGYLSIMSGRAINKYDFQNNKVVSYNNLAILDEKYRCTRVDFSLFFDYSIDLRTSLGNYEIYEHFNADIEKMENGNHWIIFDVKKEAVLGTGSRSSGIKMRRYLQNIFNNTDENIVISFENVDIISSSFADEFIAKLILEVGKETFENRFFLNKVNEACEVVISRAIKQRVDI